MKRQIPEGTYRCAVCDALRLEADAVKVVWDITTPKTDQVHYNVCTSCVAIMPELNLDDVEEAIVALQPSCSCPGCEVCKMDCGADCPGCELCGHEDGRSD